MGKDYLRLQFGNSEPEIQFKIMNVKGYFRGKVVRHTAAPNIGSNTYKRKMLLFIKEKLTLTSDIILHFMKMLQRLIFASSPQIRFLL